ncbi:type II toxin-antitoxin system HicA family toxin [Terriglobus sp.]|uniref:type II toxin-antitoxin system HicA family toxin n=1 Tax=Terriglobus sp. TaxID=1889013 RepID=UPI003AFFA22E
MKVREILRLLHDDGWRLDRQCGSHRQFKHPAKSGVVTVAGHPSIELKEGTQKSILKAGGPRAMKEYAAVFEKTSTGWSAYVPDLPGLGVGAETFEETEQLIREGIEFHLEGLRESGCDIPQPEARVRTLAVAA